MFTIDYSGYNTHNPDYDVIYRPYGYRSYLFLLILAPMRFYFGKEIEIARPGACILFTPEYPEHYEGVKEFYNSYVHFYTNENFMNEYSLQKYSFPVNKIFYPTASNEINQMIRLINIEYLTKQLHFDKKADALIRCLLSDADRYYQQSTAISSEKHDLYSDFMSLRINFLTNCKEEWNVERMCRVVNLEKSQLYYYYKQFFNSTPKEDLQNARIELVKNLLTNERIKISQAAEMSGFKNIYHFTRYFKKVCGCTPGEYMERQNERVSEH